MKKLSIFVIGFFISVPLVAYQNPNYAEDFSLVRLNRQQLALSERATASLAESYLKLLAEKEKKARQTRIVVGFVGGGFCLPLGIGLLRSSEVQPPGWEGFWEALGKAVFGTALVIEGGGLVVMGIVAVGTRSGAEREIEGVMAIPDGAQREIGSEVALASLAKRGRTNRYIIGFVGLALGALSLLQQSGDEGSANFGGVIIYAIPAAYNLLVKSRRERVYHDYLKAKELQNKLSLNVGVTPRGGVTVGFALMY